MLIRYSYGGNSNDIKFMNSYINNLAQYSFR